MEEPTTLCYCPSCIAERDDISECLSQMPPSVKQSSIANYLNVRYEQMREKCHNSKKIAEDVDIYCWDDFNYGLKKILKWASIATLIILVYILILIVGESL